MTVKVKRLSKPVSWIADLSTPSRGPVHEAMYDAIGGSEAGGHVGVRLWFFIPTKKERAKGARWIRCDVGLHAGRTGLDRLPASWRSTSLPLANQVARCLVGKTLATTACSKATRGRPRRRFKLSSRGRSPRRSTRSSAARCARSVTSTQRYASTARPREEWKAGNHFMVCFKPD